MKILLVGIQNESLLRDLRKVLINEHHEVDLIDPLEGYLLKSDDQKILFGNKPASRNFLLRNLSLLRNFFAARALFKKNNQDYEVCNLHFLDPRYYCFRKFLTRVAKRFIISTYGSDFNVYRKYSFFQLPLYRKTHKITFANHLLKERFDEFYKKEFSGKLHLCKFGLSKVEELATFKVEPETLKTFRQGLGIPDNKIIITIGYNSNPIHQQDKVIHEIMKTDPKLRENLFLIFPMTYGGFTAQISAVEHLATASCIPHIILKSFMSSEEVVCLRKTSDIMINMLTNDQLSATMCEYLFAGSYVITGDWLPYDPIDELGVYYSRIHELSALSAELTKVISNLQEIKKKTAGNAEKIQNFSRWENTIKDWIGVYSA